MSGQEMVSPLPKRPEKPQKPGKKKPGTVAPAETVTETYDIDALVGRLRNTKALGFFTKLGDNDYLARWSSGDTYRVYVNERDRVIVEKR